MRDQDISKVIQVLNQEVQQWKMPVLGHYTRSPFTVLIACLLSLRTQDKTTEEASSRLFQLAESPQDMRKLSTAAIQKAIYPVGFYKIKAAAALLDHHQRAVGHIRPEYMQTDLPILQPVQDRPLL